MNCNCDKKLADCNCLKVTAEVTAENGFDAWINVLEEEEQPTCNMDSPEDCEACGS